MVVVLTHPHMGCSVPNERLRVWQDLLLQRLLRLPSWTPWSPSLLLPSSTCSAFQAPPHARSLFSTSSTFSKSTDNRCAQQATYTTTMLPHCQVVTTTTTTPSYNQPTHKHYLPSHHPHPTHIGVSRVFYWATGAVLWMLRSKTRHSSRRWKGLRAQLPTRDAARHPHRRSPRLVFGPRLRQTRGVQRG